MGATEPPRYQSISERLETLIAKEEKVPSARAVAKEHGVSLVTASRALQVLKDKGLIRTVERAGSYLADPSKSKPKPKGARWVLFLRSTPGPWRRSSVATWLEGFEAVSRRLGEDLETKGIDGEPWDGVDDAAMVRQVRDWRDEGTLGVFFMPTRHDDASMAWDEAFLKVCQAENMPVVLIERNLRGVNRRLDHDLLSGDDLNGGFLSARHLIEQGCRRLVFITGSPTSSHEARSAGVLIAARHPFLSGPNLNLPEPKILVQKEGLPTKDAFEALAAEVLERKADGVICYQDYTAVGLIVELLRRRARVPGDLAITGFDNLPIGNSFALGVTTFACSGQEMAAAALQLLRSRIEEPGRPPRKVVVPGTLMIRESSLRTTQREPKGAKRPK